jgi:hypothetical protein
MAQGPRRDDARQRPTAAGLSVVYLLSTGRMLTVTPELDLVPGLLTVFAAVLPVRAVRFDDALAGGVGALRC